MLLAMIRSSSAYHDDQLSQLWKNSVANLAKNFHFVALKNM